MIKTDSETTRSQVWQLTPAGKGADMSKLQAQHYMTPEQSTWLLCRVSIVSANKLLLQEINPVNRN